MLSYQHGNLHHIVKIRLSLQKKSLDHYTDVIMTTMESQITSLTVVYSTVYSDTDQRKHQSSASLAFVKGIHRDRWIPRTKGQLREKCFHLMTTSCVPGIMVFMSKPGPDIHSHAYLHVGLHILNDKEMLGGRLEFLWWQVKELHCSIHQRNFSMGIPT